MPDSVKFGAGNPKAVRETDAGVPMLKTALLAFVKAGASLTVSVKDCVAAGLTPLLAVIVRHRRPRGRSACRGGVRRPSA